MKILRLLPLVAALFIAGCFQVDVDINVNPDGSGTVVEQVVMSKAVTDQMAAFDAFGGDSKEKKKKPTLLEQNLEKLKSEAKEMGEGVTFVEAKPIKNETGEGYVATYAFTDINKLKTDIGDGPELEGVEKKQDAKKNPATFKYSKGALTIIMPKDEPKKQDEKKAKKADEGQDDMAMGMMQQFFKDTRMSLKVNVKGKITQTDASHVEGSTITIAHIEFGKLLSEPKKFKQLMEIDDAAEGMKAAATLFKDNKAILFETKKEVSVKFE